MTKSLVKTRTGAKRIVALRRVEEVIKVILIVAIVIAINEISNRATRFVMDSMSFSQIKLCFFVLILGISMYTYLKSCAEIKQIESK